MVIKHSLINDKKIFNFFNLFKGSKKLFKIVDVYVFNFQNTPSTFLQHLLHAASFQHESVHSKIMSAMSLNVS